jgi:hypothetical protein
MPAARKNLSWFVIIPIINFGRMQVNGFFAIEERNWRNIFRVFVTLQCV